jgi:transcriptional regulator with XRE-family HTH domain
MAQSIAIIATNVKRVRRDYRPYPNVAISDTIHPMDIIDGEWIRARMTGKRGEQARLAEHLGISTDKLSKTMRGQRDVQPEEIPGLLSFFNVELAPASEDDRHQLFKEIDRLNATGQALLRTQLAALLEVPELTRQSGSNREGEQPDHPAKKQ